MSPPPPPVKSDAEREAERKEATSKAEQKAKFDKKAAEILAAAKDTAAREQSEILIRQLKAARLAKDNRSAASLLAMGQTLQKQKMFAGAQGYYWRIIHLFPDHPEAKSAASIVAKTFSPVDVVRVVDGDTIVVRKTKGNVTVRLIGVDTPETVHPTKKVERFGKEASDFLKRYLDKQRVYLVPDNIGDKEDRYGRTLAYVYRLPDHMFVNQAIIAEGYGHAYVKYPFSLMEDFRLIEKQAREEGRGLWAEESP